MIARLVDKNPAHVLPALRHRLIQLLLELRVLMSPPGVSLPADSHASRTLSDRDRDRAREDHFVTTRPEEWVPALLASTTLLGQVIHASPRSMILPYVAPILAVLTPHLKPSKR